MNTGTKLRRTMRTCSDARSRPNRRSGATRITTGSWMRNCSALPTTDPIASFIARSGSSERPPKTRSVAIIAAFQTTGAAYDSRNRWWLLRTPRHHADMTSSPAPGNRMRTSDVVSTRFSPVKPGAMRSISSGVANTPTRTSSDTTRARIDATAPATRSASRRSPFATNAAYTGMKDADSAPSPNRFCRKLGMQHVAANLAAERDLLLRAPDRIELGLIFLQFQIVQPRFQHLHRRIAVAVLRPLVLAGDDDAGRHVRDADRGVGDVDVLAAGAARSIRVDADVLVVDLDVDVLGQFRPRIDRRERRVAARCLIERRDADETMDADFRREQTERVLAGDRQRRALDARLVARLLVDDLLLEAAPIHPAHVQSQQHLGPVLRFGAAGAGMDRENRVPPIVLAAEHLLDFGGLHFAVERVERLPQLAIDGLAGFEPFDEDGEIVALLGQRSRQVAVLLEPATALQDLLCLGLIFPEIGSGGARFEARQLFVGAGGLKDSSADPQRVC